MNTIVIESIVIVLFVFFIIVAIGLVKLSVKAYRWLASWGKK